MADSAVTKPKLDRRGGWNRKAPTPDTRHDGPLGPPAAARDPIAFINSLTHTKGAFARQTFNLRPWQVRIVDELFKKRPDGLRQYRTCLLMLPRKNGKSELAAAIALYGLLADGETGAEVYSAASDRDQAGLVFGVAAQMIRNDPQLDAACYIVESQKRVVHRGSGSVYRAISAEAYSKHGFNASMVIYDELHAAPDRRLYDVLATSMGGREQPLLLVISTAGYDRHSILWELYAHAKKVQENPALDPTFLPILYEAPIDADWTDEQVWRAANPALGDFRSLEEMQTVAARATAIPAQENTFRRLYLNQWTEQASRWIALAAWDRCAVAVDRASLAGRKCFVGMDLASTTDLTALVAVFPDEAGFTVLPHFFMPAERIVERGLRDRVPYDQWARDGLLTAIPGAVVDYEIVRRTVVAWAAQYQVRMVAYDPWNATDLVGRLREQDGIDCVPMRQGYASLSAPTKSLERAILSGTLRHDGHPVLRWNIGNVAVETDPAGNLKPSKAVSTDRIDGVVALIMAVDLLDRNAREQDRQYSILVMG
ncbi:MAG TPA: terminase TerL endonuclease subunit [Polyangia bacterium]|nr:terminase TerL endonuclease subunit [Polyangia bacterium]